jgi:hypothetical protein
MPASRSHRRNPWEWEAPGFFESFTFVPANQKETLEAWAREYRALVDEIDLYYERGDAQLAEELEGRAEWLLQRIEAAVAEIEVNEGDASGPHGDDEPDPFEGEIDSEEERGGSPGLEEELARLWQEWLNGDGRFDVIPRHDHPQGIYTREQQFVRIARGIVLDRLHAAGGELAVRGSVPTDLSRFPDRAFFEAAQDAWNRRRGLVREHLEWRAGGAGEEALRDARQRLRDAWEEGGHGEPWKKKRRGRR